MLDGLGRFGLSSCFQFMSGIKLVCIKVLVLFARLTALAAAQRDERVSVFEAHTSPELGFKAYVRGRITVAFLRISLGHVFLQS